MPLHSTGMSHAPKKLVVGISSRALFDLEASHTVFEKQGREAYCNYQIEHEEDILEPGVAFGLVRKLLALNDAEHERVEVILLSRNSADTGLRVFNSIAHHRLPISRPHSPAATPRIVTWAHLVPTCFSRPIRTTYARH